MNITEHEMRGLLAGKCLPGDMRVNEQLPAYLARKFAELKAERDALAVLAEERRQFIVNGVDMGYIMLPVIDGDPAIGIHERCLLKPKFAYDAYLNSVRADVIKDFCQLVGQYGKVEPHHFNADFSDLYAKINKEIYESILDNPAVYDMESLVDWLERGVNDSRAYADMSSQHANQLRAGEPS